MARPKKQKKRKKPGLPPGSLIFTGQKKVENPNVTILKYNEKDLTELKPSDLELAQPEEGFVSWYDVRGLHETALVDKIGTAFNIHPLVREDVLDIQQRPKFEAYKSGFFIVVRSLKWEKDQEEIQSEQVSIYVGKDFVLSFQETEDDVFLPVRERLLNSNGRIRMRGADYLAYALVDSVVDGYFHVLDRIEENIEDLEDDIFEGRHDNVKMRIHEQRRDVVGLRRSIAPLREAINRFSKSEHELIAELTTVFIRDIYDHTIQIVELMEFYRDALTNLQDLYLSEISFKMNQVMQVLTIIATIFIPLTFLAGIYGMNFDNIPELHWKYSYFVLWGLMILVTLILLRYFRKKQWL